MRKTSLVLWYLLLSGHAPGMQAQPYPLQYAEYQPYTYQPYGYQRAPGMAPQQKGWDVPAAQQPGQPPAYPGAGQHWPQQYGYPYQQQPYQQQPYRQAPQPAFEPPVVEAWVGDNTPYEQQSLIYKIRVTSSGNVKTMAPELPRLDAVVLRQLGEATTETRETGGRKEFITEYRYLLMPLATGIVRIPAARISGVRTGREELEYEAAAADPVILQVQPAAARAQPWLPLYGLKIDARLVDTDDIVTGQPVTLEVETTAVGTTGAQIPSIASQLVSEDFRIYPAGSETQGRVASDGSTLLGFRVERFTLVPQYSGWLTIPTMRLDWWNVQYNRPEVAAFPQRRFRATGSAPERGSIAADGTVPSSGWGAALFWLPLLVAMGIAIYGLMGAALVGSGRLPGLAMLGNLFKPVLGDLYKPLTALVSKYSPRRHFHRLRTWTGRRLPVSWKLWFCLRAVAREHDAEAWGQALQILAAKHLGVRPQTDLKYIGQHIAACHPRANASQVDRLMRELDEAIYGGVPIKYFARWKREFESQIAPSLFPIRFRQCKLVAAKRTLLPRLNPGV